MKAKQTIILLIFAIAGLTSCEKNLYDPSKNQEEQTMNDLVVPDNFDWNMTKAAICNIVSDNSSVSIYRDEACSENELLATIPAHAEINELPLTILKDAKNVYIKYTNAEDEEIVKTAAVNADGKINFIVPTDAKRALTRADEDFESDTPGLLYYPKAGWGTLMFEDNYPATGDYDFNDFVVKYVLTTTINPKDEFKTIQKLTFEMNVYAIGGTIPYVPCLRLPFAPNTIKNVSITSDDNRVELETTEDMYVKGFEHVVFVFKGAEKNVDKNPASKYLNTEKGITSSTKLMVLTVEFNENSAFMSDLGKNFLDFFLVSPDRSKEIHMLGFAPAFQPDSSNPPYGENNYYKSDGNKVWAVNIPNGDVKHALETVNFLKAYPTFKEWVESAGENNVEWYKNAQAEFLF